MDRKQKKCVYFVLHSQNEGYLVLDNHHFIDLVLKKTLEFFIVGQKEKWLYYVHENFFFLYDKTYLLQK